MDKEYKEIKKRLLAQKESVEYFTEGWFKLFCSCSENAENGVSNPYAPIFSTDFYNLNSCGYCVFQEIFLDVCLKRFVVYIYDKTDWDICIGRRYERYSTKEACEKAYQRAGFRFKVEAA